MKIKINNKLEKIIKKNLRLKNFDNFHKIKKMKFGDELDSLSLIAIIADIVRQFKIKIDANQISKIKSIEDLIKLKINNK